MILPGDNQTIEQITKQLNKLIQVIEIKDITTRPCVERELMLVKVSSSPKFVLKLLISLIFFVRKLLIYQIFQQLSK